MRETNLSSERIYSIMNPKQKKELEMYKQAYEQPRMSKEQVNIMKEKIEAAKEQNRRDRRKRVMWARTGVAAAAAAALFITLPNTSPNIAHAMENIPILGRLVEVVTFRNYQYEDERHYADVDLPELVSPEGTTADKDAAQTPDNVQESLQKSTEEINAEIQKLTQPFLEEFEESLKSEEGYQDVVIKSEVINTTQDYFTLKLLCYQGIASGAEWNYYYTIDLNTGKRLTLKDLFTDGADYITPISENIKEQMREQMDADENKIYWLEDEMEEMNFQKITDETAFYLNENGNIVISFNEGDVAPMYMGVVTFEIPNDVVKNILK